MAHDTSKDANRVGKSTMAACLARIAEHQDHEAFETVFSHYGPRIKSFMLRRGAPPEMAEDLLQETMVAVWQKAALYSPAKGSVTTWIYTIARNQRIDRLRRDGNVRFTGLEDIDVAGEDVPGDESVARAQEDQLVREALKQLPKDQSELLALSYLEDMSQSRIAEKLGLPLGTVKSRMRLAYGKMRRKLERTL